MEKDILNRAYLRLIKHVNSIFKIRIVYGMIEDMVVKYFWSACGKLRFFVFESWLTDVLQDTA